jgi:hypothetical protein
MLEETRQKVGSVERQWEERLAAGMLSSLLPLSCATARGDSLSEELAALPGQTMTDLREELHRVRRGTCSTLAHL